MKRYFTVFSIVTVIPLSILVDGSWISFVQAEAFGMYRVKPGTHTLTYRGMNYACWSQDSYFAGTESLDKLANAEINSISLIVTWYMKSASSTNIARSTDINPNDKRTPSELSLKHVIKYAHDREIKVLLKPCIGLVDSSSSVIREKISPSNYDQWFNSYRKFILHFAELAQNNKVEIFCIGSELDWLIKDNSSKWENLISDIRDIYSGKLVYAGNKDNYWRIPLTFWNRLDYAGINVYFALSNEKNPDLESLEKGWVSYRDEGGGLHNWSRQLDSWQNEIKKPLIITEIGYRSIDYGAKIFSNESSYSPNPVLQANCYHAFFRVFKNKEYLKGIYWWYWSPDINAGGIDDEGFTPQNKLAEDILTEWYKHLAAIPYGNYPPPCILYPPEVTNTSLVKLSWEKNRDVDFAAYKLYRSISPNVSTSSLLVKLIKNREDTSLSDEDVMRGKKYYYRLYVFNTNGLSLQSNKVEVYIPIPESEPFIYPNPLRYDQGYNEFTIEGLTQNATIKIYDFLGKLVRTIEVNNSNGIAKWDIKNDHGEKVGSGIYFCVIEDGRGKKIEKIAIIK